MAVRAVGRIISGRSVDKIIVNQSFRVSTIKNKNIEHSGKELFGLPNQNKSSASLPFLFDFFELKEKGHFRKKKFI